MRSAFTTAFLIGVASLPGCVVVQTGVTNPIPGMTTVAVAPFVNLSAERSVDGRRFALAYHAELQKIPGYQVIPVGVTEQAMFDLGLDLDGPDDALKLAEALGADAVVIGAVTDYNPYYPPRVGLQVSWYSPEPWRFVPGIPTDPQLGEAVRGWRFAGRGRAGALPTVSPYEGDVRIVRAQSPDAASPNGRVVHADAVGDGNPVRLAGIETTESGPGPILFPPFPDRDEPPTAVRTVAAEQPIPAPAVPPPVEPASPADDPPAERPTFVPPEAGGPTAICPPIDSAPFLEGVPAAPLGPHDPRQPVMSYTRLFDGSDADLTALLRDYVLLSGDLRSGGWEAYLHRTEDFIRFTSHRMIVEMLTLHGGESKRRYVWLLNRERH